MHSKGGDGGMGGCLWRRRGGGQVRERERDSELVETVSFIDRQKGAQLVSRVRFLPHAQNSATTSPLSLYLHEATHAGIGLDPRMSPSASSENPACPGCSQTAQGQVCRICTSF